MKQLLLREDDDFDLVTVYDTYKDLLSMKVHHGGSFTPKGGKEYILANISFVDLLDINGFSVHTVDGIVKELGYSATKVSDDDLEDEGDNHIEFEVNDDNDGFVDEQNMIKDVDVDMQPFKDDRDMKESFVRRCDLIESQVDVSEADLDVINLDSFSNDLEDGVDNERRKMLRELRKKGKSTDKGMFDYDFLVGQRAFRRIYVCLDALKKGFKATGRDINGFDSLFHEGFLS
nr:transposase, MuDR, plant [Tanacetum cinerariifolium]